MASLLLKAVFLAPFAFVMLLLKHCHRQYPLCERRRSISVHASDTDNASSCTLFCRNRSAFQMKVVSSGSRRSWLVSICLLRTSYFLWMICMSGFVSLIALTFAKNRSGSIGPRSRAGMGTLTIDPYLEALNRCVDGCTPGFHAYLHVLDLL